MRINGSRVDDIKKEREEYLAKNARDQEEYDRREAQYDVDAARVEADIQDAIEKIFSKYNLLDMTCNVECWDEKTARVRISVNEYFREEHAFRWQYNATVSPKTGQVERETNSWSGLDATQPQHIAELRQAVDAMEELNGLDWRTLTDVGGRYPKRADYFRTGENDFMRNPEYEKESKEREFDRQIRDAQLGEIVGDDHKWIIIKDWLTPKDSRDYQRRGEYAVRILRETPSQYEVEAVWVGRDRPVEEIHQIIENKINSPYQQKYRLRKSSVEPRLDENGELAIFDI